MEGNSAWVPTAPGPGMLSAHARRKGVPRGRACPALRWEGTCRKEADGPRGALPEVFPTHRACWPRAQSAFPWLAGILVQSGCARQSREMGGWLRVECTEGWVVGIQGWLRGQIFPGWGFKDRGQGVCPAPSRAREAAALVTAGLGSAQRQALPQGKPTGAAHPCKDGARQSPWPRVHSSWGRGWASARLLSNPSPFLGWTEPLRGCRAP